MKTTLMETLGTYPAPDTLDNIIFDALYEDGDFDNDANYCVAWPSPAGGWNEEFGYRTPDAAQVQSVEGRRRPGGDRVPGIRLQT